MPDRKGIGTVWDVANEDNLPSGTSVRRHGIAVVEWGRFQIGGLEESCGAERQTPAKREG